MTDSVVVRERPTLDSPTLVVMLQGWIDASGAAAAAMALIEQACDARTIATFDRDTFIDYRARRPVMELRDGVNTRLVWPSIELKYGRDRGGHDILLLTGHEPDAAWEHFADVASGLGIELGVSMMIGIGAYPFATPHSRASRLSASSPDAALAASIPYLRSSVDVPAGMEAVLEHAFTDRGVPALGLWAQVPHYVAAMSFPAASVALLTGLHETAGIDVDTSELRQEAVIQRERLDELVENNDEHRAMVRQLEQLYDRQEQEDAGADRGDAPLTAADLPSADELAAELERFLRDQNE